MPLPPGLTFRSVYCARSNCSREEFARSVFWKTVPPDRRVVVLPLRLAYPALFELDFELVETVGKVNSMEAFENEVVLHLGGIRERSWVRERLKLRVSLHRLRRLAQECLPKE